MRQKRQTSVDTKTSRQFKANPSGWLGNIAWLFLLLLAVVLIGSGPAQARQSRSHSDTQPSRPYAANSPEDQGTKADTVKDSGGTKVPDLTATPQGYTTVLVPDRPTGSQNEQMKSLSPILGLPSTNTPRPTAPAQPGDTPTPTASPTTLPRLEPTEVRHSRLALAAESALPTPDGKRRQVRIPILMYHYISDPPKRADVVRRDLSLPGPDFELQLRYLANEGYHSISLSDLVMHLQRGTSLPPKPIVLTFDDGYKDAFSIAFPLLKKYGFTGTFFIFTKPIEEENRDYLSWRDIELMSAAGMEFGSHSYSHPDLRGKPRDFLTQELVDSKTAIEAHIRQPVRFFCYPAGDYDKKVARAVQEAGYWAAVTIQQGIEHSSDDLLEMTRIRVRGEDGLEHFDVLLSMDW